MELLRIIIGPLLTLVATILTLLVRREIREVHLSLNSRLDELVRSSKETAHAQGLAQGRKEKKAEDSV